jgi:hypothetical protein
VPVAALYGRTSIGKGESEKNFSMEVVLGRDNRLRATYGRSMSCQPERVQQYCCTVLEISIQSECSIRTRIRIDLLVAQYSLQITYVCELMQGYQE